MEIEVTGSQWNAFMRKYAEYENSDFHASELKPDGVRRELLGLYSVQNDSLVTVYEGYIMTGENDGHCGWEDVLDLIQEFII